MSGESTSGSTEREGAGTPRSVSRADFLRRSGLVLGASALGAPVLDALTGSPAMAAPMRRGMSKAITMRYAHVFVAGTPQANIIQGFADKVKSRTNSQVQIQVFPSSQLGNDTETFQQCEQGAIDIVGTSTGIQAAIPQLGLFYLPYLYADVPHFERIWTVGGSDTSKWMEQLVTQHTGVKMLGYLVSGIRDTINRVRPIKTVSDFNGLKERYDGSQLSHDTVAALGATPVFVNYADVYTALKSGVIDAAENPAIYFISLSWDQGAHYVSLTGHQIIMLVQAINQQKWASLGAANQKIVQTAMNETVKQFNAVTVAARPAAMSTLTQLGLAVNNISSRASFAAACKPVTTSFVKQYSLGGALSEIVALQSKPLTKKKSAPKKKKKK
jgi:TRAP-type transport system periplasmic protein